MQETTTGAHVRRAAAGEADAAAEVLITARRAAVPAIPPSVHPEDEVRDWFRRHVMATMDVWVAVSGSSVVGVLVLTEGWIEQLYVLPGWQGARIGTALVARAKAEASGGLDLWTFAANVGAQRFYRRHGFVVVDRTGGDNEEGAPDLRFRWTPPASGGPGPT